ncbi:MAG: hypothetical protein WCL38_06110 [Actinomycetota bacterium]
MVTIDATDTAISPTRRTWWSPLLRVATWNSPNAAMFAFYWAVVAMFIYTYNNIFNPSLDWGFNSNDWLINYGGGFVRRGLFGELLIDFHSLFPVASLTRELQLIQISLYVA